MDPEYCRDLLVLADRFGAWRQDHHIGDPDAAPHRADDPATVARLEDRRAVWPSLDESRS